MASSSGIVEMNDEHEVESTPTATLQQSKPILSIETDPDHNSVKDTSPGQGISLVACNAAIAGAGTHQHNGHIFNGPIYNTNITDYSSFFSSLTIEPHEITTANDAARRILTKRLQFQAGRRLRHLEYSDYYAPYTIVRNRKIRSRLFGIAESFQFLDRGFAKYFQTVVPSYNQPDVHELLDNVRKDIASRQNRNPEREIDSESVYLGDLGHFCEGVSHTWTQPARPNPVFTVTHRRHELLHYLQDALEVPYWEFMVDLFLGLRANSKDLSGEVVLRVLDNVKLDVLCGKRHLLDELAELEGMDKEDITPIVKGIDARIHVLESIWDKKTSGFEKDNLLASLFEKPTTSSGVTIREQPQQQQDGASHPNETVILITLIIVFLVGAIIPGYKAFAISMQISSPGSTADADFWYLIQNSIMVVLGNIIMIIPLLRKSWFSPAYTLMWTFSMLGLAFSVIAIIIYPLLNTGWSSMLSFFGSIASAASVLIITQATSRGKNRDKVKTD